MKSMSRKNLGATTTANLHHQLGLDFLDVKKEISDELKEADRRAVETYLKNQRRKTH
jgi:hypothetical protein